MNETRERHSTARSSRLVSLFAAGALAAAALPAAWAAHGPPPVSGPYDGFAAASVVHADALTAGGVRVANVEVGPVSAAVNAGGLSEVISERGRPVAPDDPEEHTAAAASILEAGALLQPPEAANQLAPFSVNSTAPGGEPESASTLTQQIAPLIHLDMLQTDATARWSETGCLVGAPLAHGEQQVARVELVETGDPTDDGFEAPLLAIGEREGAPVQGASHTSAREQLYVGSGPGFGLQSVVTATVGPVTLFAGTANEFTVEVGGPAVLSVAADGTPGGASVIYREPTVTVIRDGDATEVLSPTPVTVRVPPTGDAIAVVQIGTLDPIPEPKGLGDATEADDGTRAAAQAHVVEILLLDVVSQDLGGVTLTIGHMEAAAQVPEGGIICQLPVTKVAVPEEVMTGDAFTVTITVHNPHECRLEGTFVTDLITTELAARFEIGPATPPPISATPGSMLAAGTIIWSLGTIDPGESAEIEVEMIAQGGGGRIIDTVLAEATLTNCAGGLDEGAVDLTTLVDLEIPAIGSAELEVIVGEVLAESTPATGVGVNGALTAGLLLAAALLIAARRLGASVDA